jgi:hypothetical protein
VFRHENRVWRVNVKKIKDAISIKIKGEKNTSTRAYLKEILETIEMAPKAHVEIMVNSKEVCNALSNWVFS